MTASPTSPRWLTAGQHDAWRSYQRMQTRLSARLHRQLQSDSDLSLPDFEVLVALTDCPTGRLRAFELGRALRWEKSRLSHQVSRMERRGLVARQECPSDGRGAFVVLTPAGRAAIEAAAPGHADAVHRLVFDGLDDEQVHALHEICQTVLARLDDDKDPDT